jgi:hypothetical protein
MELLISRLRWLARNWNVWPWLDRLMGVGPGWGLTLLAVGFAMQMHWLPDFVSWLLVGLRVRQ